MTEDYQIIILPIAERQLRQAVAWWNGNRPAARGLMLDEFEKALVQLAHAPHAGAPYLPRPGVRRWLLRTVRYHIYYRVDEATHTIYVRALWHATRGRGPSLR